MFALYIYMLLYFIYIYTHTYIFTNVISLFCVDLLYHYIIPFFVFFFWSLVFRATPMAYGGSQARGRIRATAASLHPATAMPDLNLVCNLYHISMATPDP